MSKSTPEGIVKKQIRDYLDEIGAYHFCPVQMGMGARTLDILACVHGRFIGIEVKRPGIVDPSPLQRITIKKIADAGGVAFTTDGFMRAKKFIDDFGLGLYDPTSEVRFFGRKKVIYDAVKRFPEGVTSERLRNIVYAGEEDPPQQNTLSVQIVQINKELASFGKSIRCGHWGNTTQGIYRLVNEPYTPRVMTKKNNVARQG